MISKDVILSAFVSRQLAGDGPPGGDDCPLTSAAYRQWSALTTDFCPAASRVSNSVAHGSSFHVTFFARGTAHR